MKQQSSQQRHLCKSSCILLFVSIIIFFIPTTIAQTEKTLTINIYDHQSGEKITDGYIFEGKQYDLEILDAETNTVQYNAIITTPWETSTTSVEVPNVLITAPSYEEYPQFIISASKESYERNEETIIVLKGSISIVLEQEISEEKKPFLVQVTDSSNLPLQGVSVKINGCQSASSTTNNQGKAYLIAPDIDQTKELTITAFKDGYNGASTTIQIQNVPDFNFPLDTNTIIIILAIIILIIAILFVRFRQQSQTKKFTSQNIQSSEQPKSSQDLKPYTKTISPIERKRQNIEKTCVEKIHIMDKGAKIEEIRIQGHEQKKETQIISAEKKSTKTTSDKPLDAEEWFNGTEYTRYKIDELTGKIDSQTTGKWFEGVDTIKSKVDDKLKKNYKKKSNSP
jgi:hypothetical protein